ncbi:MAG: phage holin family protein [Verrucomicrobiaceae bacterium]|nr:phage holin family protein [Verrucomicrobiaceae bacterium]
MENGPTAPTASAGHSSRVAGLLRAVALYVEARGRLLQIEGQEAGVKASSLTGHVVLTLASLVIGWMLATPALIWMIAERSGWHWAKVALCGAGAHLFICFILLIALKARLKRLRLFEETFNQFRRDREWLASTSND